MNEDDLRQAFMNELQNRPEEFKGNIDLDRSCYKKKWTLQEIERFARNLKLEISYLKVNKD